MKKKSTFRLNKVSLITIIFLFVTFGQALNDNSVVLGQDSTRSSEKDTKVQQNRKTQPEIIDESDELQESDITTKIYRSTDSTSELLEQDPNNESAIEEDIFTKEDILGKHKKVKNKIVERSKTKETHVNQNNKNLLLPWTVLILFIAVLSVIFKLILQKKI